MKYPNIDDLLQLIQSHKIKREYIPIKNGQYTCGYVIKGIDTVVLNEKNSLVCDMETYSHELMHIWYEFANNISLPETEIEWIALTELDMVKEYREAVRRRVLDYEHR